VQKLILISILNATSDTGWYSDHAGLATRVQLAAFGWEHAIVLAADGCVRTFTTPLPVFNDSKGGEDLVARSSRQPLSIPEAAVAIAAGEQHRYHVFLLRSPHGVM
jgi:hypothetical protein